MLDLYESEWTVYSTRLCIQCDESRIKAPKDMPLAEDIKCLRNFCQQEIEKFLNDVRVTRTGWRWLADLTLCMIITFNARRGSEPPALTIEEWKDAESDKWKRSHALSLLKESERRLADRLLCCLY